MSGATHGEGALKCAREADTHAEEIFKQAFGDLNNAIHMIEGDVYEGSWSNDMPNGKGTLVEGCGRVYEGDFTH